MSDLQRRIQAKLAEVNRRLTSGDLTTQEWSDAQVMRGQLEMMNEWASSPLIRALVRRVIDLENKILKIDA